MGMKKRMLAMAVVFVASICCGYTNIAEIVGRHLSAIELEQIQVDDFSTPHKCLLAFERSMYDGSLTNAFKCLTVSAQTEMFGTTNVSEIAEQKHLEFWQLATSNQTSMLDETKNVIFTNNIFEVKTKTHDTFNNYSRFGYFRYKVILENGSWKIDEWEDLLLSEYEDND